MQPRRYFQKPNGQHINEKIAYIEFDLTGESVWATAIAPDGTRRPNANWRLKDAHSLVGSGHWVEIDDPKNTDRPLTNIEGGAW